MEGMRVFILCAIVAMSVAYPTGPPSSACTSMTPSHDDTLPQSDETGAFVIHLTATDTYWDNRTIEVQIKATDVKGFMVQARKKDNLGNFTIPVGTFEDVLSTSSEGKTMTCTHPKSAWVHKNKDLKNNPKATWTAPDYDQGEIVFIATVVKHFDTFWTNQRSVTLRPYTGYPVGGASQLQNFIFIPTVLIYLLVSKIISRFSY